VATLHLICGLPGSGKTTLAARLAEAGSILWLSPDRWLRELNLDGYDEARRADVERLQRDLAMRLLALGVDVILDNGFWSRAEREGLRTEAAALGARVRLHYLDVPIDELKRRLAIRNERGPADSFAVSPADLDQWQAVFEPPDADELS
jgi:predicted kinase